MAKPARRLAPATIELPDGARAVRAGDALELTAPDGMLLVRYENGVMHIAPPKGDLELSAPHGRVVIRAAMDVQVEAGRDVTYRAGRKLDIESREVKLKSTKLEVESKSSRLVSGSAVVLARKIATTAEVIATRCVTLETEATKIVERSKEAFRDVSDLAQSRFGRARTIVKDVFTLHARRSVMTTKEDTTIDGDKILIG